MKNLIIAKIDGTKNDVDGVIVDGYPTVMYYGVGNNQNGEMYKDHLTVKKITKFLQDKMGDDFTYEGDIDEDTDL